MINIPSVKNDPLTPRSVTTSINETIKTTNAQNVVALEGSDILVAAAPHGTTFDYKPRVSGFLQFQVVLVASGPNGEADFTDGRYWAMGTIMAQAAYATVTDTASVYIDPSYSFWGVVHNVSELVTGTHNLPVYTGSKTIALAGNVPVYHVSILDVAKIGGTADDPANAIFIIRSEPAFFAHAKILAATAINGQIQYRYTIELGQWATPSTTSSGTWTATSTGTIYAYNTIEDKNIFVGSGTTGTNNTVASTTGVINSGSCVFKALPVGGYVVVTYRGTANSIPYYSIINATNSSQ